MTEPEAASELQMQLLLAKGICFSLKKKKKSLLSFVWFLSGEEQHKTWSVLGDLEDPTYLRREQI